MIEKKLMRCCCCCFFKWRLHLIFCLQKKQDRKLGNFMRRGLNFTILFYCENLSLLHYMSCRGCVPVYLTILHENLCYTDTYVTFSESLTRSSSPLPPQSEGFQQQHLSTDSKTPGFTFKMNNTNPGQESLEERPHHLPTYEPCVCLRG